MDPSLDQLAADPVLQWRTQQLVEAGLTIPQALSLAVTSLDLHDMCATATRLLHEGATQELVFDILSP